MVYGLARFSRARSTKACAAAATVADVFGFVGEVLGVPVPGFRGRGGGARSGSELSHLFCSSVSFCLRLRVLFLVKRNIACVQGATRRKDERYTLFTHIGI